MNKKENKKSFWRMFWASTLSKLITSIVVGLICMFVFLGIIGALAGGFAAEPLKVSEHSVLHMKLTGTIGETSKAEFNPMAMQLNSSLGLSDILTGIEEAAKDENIDGIYLEMGSISAGLATVTEIREALVKFKESGKFLIAYNSGEAITQKGYFLTSVADECYGFPTSMFEWMGLSSEKMFYKGLLDKLDVKVQIIRGSDNDFKSAVEPFFLEKMSDSSRVQTERYINGLWDNMLTEISISRSISVAKLNEIADSVYVTRNLDAYKYGLLDSTLYLDNIYDKLMAKTGVSELKELNLVKFSRYAKSQSLRRNTMDEFNDQNLAVIIAEGNVTTGTGDGVASGRICKYIRDARLDDNIKAIVLRVNSPGGSALASEEIWREVQLADKVKPVVVSMGDVAASGGYYIAAPSRYIFAQNNTITGSIGVFGMIPNTEDFFKNQLGITFDRAKTNTHTGMSINRALTEKEFSLIQKEIDFIYGDFVQKVADGRDQLDVKRVRQIARGRVWTGTDALAIGLIDEIGGLQDAIVKANELGEITESKVRFYPKRVADPLVSFLEMQQDQQDKHDKMLTIKNNELPEEITTYLNEIKNIKSMTGIQARLPYDIYIH
jgi:protease-4